jgi:hypothetical protein
LDEIGMPKQTVFRKKPISSIFLLCLLCIFNPFQGQARAGDIDEDQLGAWYMYFWSKQLKESPFGFQGDLQFRNWDLGGDLEQLLLRGGLTYVPKAINVKFTLGYAFILTGEFGDSSDTSNENRIYQEALLPHKLGGRTYINHRFRFEQRWVENQDFRTRWRYGLFIQVALNRKELIKGTFYYAFYDEIFINGERGIGDGREVELFDRNRFYNAIGYCISDNLRFQGGYMYQSTDDWSKGQIQLSLHHSF